MGKSIWGNPILQKGNPIWKKNGYEQTRVHSLTNKKRQAHIFKKVRKKNIPFWKFLLVPFNLYYLPLERKSSTRPKKKYLPLLTKFKEIFFLSILLNSLHGTYEIPKIGTEARSYTTFFINSFNNLITTTSSLTIFSVLINHIY